MTDFILNLIQSWGYVGIFILMFLENVFPPIPSEVIMGGAGVLVAKGEMTFLTVWLVATAGTVAGNLFELGEVTGCRLLDLHFPEDYARQFAGPRFGVRGTREKAGVEGRPIIGTIVKPALGLRPPETAALVKELIAADVDFIKDDEKLASPAYSPSSRPARNWTWPYSFIPGT